MKCILRMFMAMACGVAVADSVSLKNGSIINGEIISIYQEKMIIETNFCDDLTIDMSEVKSYRTDEDVNIELTSGTKLTGTRVGLEEKIKVTSKTDEIKLDSEIKAESVKMLWPKGDDAPNYIPPFQKEWKTTIAASFEKDTGNTEEVEYNLSAESILKGERDTTKLFLRYENTTKKDVRTDDETIGGIDYEYRIKGKNTVYARGELERDPFEDIDLRLQMAIGYGRYLIDKERLTLRGRLGAFYRHETFTSSRKPVNTWGPDIGLRFDYASLNDWSVYSGISYTPSIDNFQNCLIFHESALVAPIASSQWSLKIGIRHEFNSDSSDGKEDLDTTYFTNLQLTF